jgi:hypothetical protein
MPMESDKPSPVPAPRLPEGLDAASLREIEEAQAAMRVLIDLIPRQFGYADEIDLVFRPDRSQLPSAHDR